MIQRIQSIYLLLSAITLGLALKLPFMIFIMKDTDVFKYDAFGFVNEFEPTVANGIGFPVYYLIFPALVISILSIFLFKSRTKQLQLGRLNYLVIIAIIVLIFIGFNIVESKMASATLVSQHYGYGFLAPCAALVFTFLANRKIKADEDLIKSIDRIR